MAAKGPLRKIVEIVEEQRWTPEGGASLYIAERLECGHLREPTYNSHFGGRNIGYVGDRRRCEQCVVATLAD